MKTGIKAALMFTAALVAAAAMTGTSFAAYTLNPEVKDPTPALKQAAQIGVRVYNNPAMRDAPNKDAMVIMSFGTTFTGPLKSCIYATVDSIKAQLPGTKVVLAFTSHIIVDRLKSKSNITIPTPEKALEDLRKAGYTRIALATLDLFPGMEYDYDAAIFDIYKDQFKKMTLGIPIMYWMGQEGQRDDIEEFVKMFSSQFPKQLGANDALLVMAHGTPHPSNAFYSVVQIRLDRAKLGNVYIFTVEGWPGLEDVMKTLKEKNIKNVTLMPMMLVAGDHATNDMAGDEPDSFKNQLKKEGFNVSTYIHGLGENKNIQKLFIERADESWKALITPVCQTKTKTK